ncbi:DUF3429 domain-containing protein [Colwellia sp. MB02u-18]|uniref:DUF3429 domain-containing protein n=1 Tax=unclassified Colwellia TaxID=196834 RepID=UPI0015F52A2C|nr:MULTISPECIES: DUF3429 domain-containing protein [unclassified Colwellia]MBA6225914.1 DUF3429 domain-containing protein [Colwellia sp. MB3u-45]MBA6267150.1 DUF3429 domain-containing protein [Colwellia sp. MB3u-43]MBA6322074.1 DUF3429 domain-containing protein [Colwellia sp. MB02u-19]MBA6325304.1 DUF3429 domain-containing protein [Colwellia sp. MB02u-18]MBA6330323.1 DUF3429 domain-containing protein [Colwellia sp. MB02u-12]
MQMQQILGYLGLAPFVLALVFEKFSPTLLNIAAEQVFIFYSAIILSFIAGTLWRKHNDKLSIKLQLCSNIFSLLAFFALLLPNYLALVILAVSYPAILCCEYYFDTAKNEHKSYLRMRLKLTTLVVIMHIIAVLLWCT